MKKCEILRGSRTKGTAKKRSDKGAIKKKTKERGLVGE